MSELPTQILPFGSMAIAWGLAIEGPENPLEPDIGEPLALSSVTLPSPPEPWKFVIQTFPAPSIAMAVGFRSPPPVKPIAGDRGWPLELSSLTLPLPLFAVQTFPLASMAIPDGPLIPPPVKLSAMVQSAAPLEPGLNTTGRVARARISEALTNPGFRAIDKIACRVSLLTTDPAGTGQPAAGLGLGTAQ